MRPFTILLTRSTAASLCALFAVSVKAQQRSVSVFDRGFEAAIVFPDGRVFKKLASADMQVLAFDTIRVVVGVGQSLKRLLRAEFVRPDVGALNWVYGANPRLAHADSIQAGDSLLIPSAARLVSAGRIPAATKIAIFKLASARWQFAPSPDELLEKFSPSSGAGVWQTDDGRRVESLWRTLAHQYQDLTLPRASITDSTAKFVDSQIRRLQVLTAQWAASSQTTAELAASIADVSQFMSITVATAEAGSTPDVEVTVKTLITGTTDKATNVRLRFVDELHYHSGGCYPAMNPACGDAFQRDEPEHVQRLFYNGKFRVWATRSGKLASCARKIKPLRGGDAVWNLDVFAAVNDSAQPKCQEE